MKEESSNKRGTLLARSGLYYPGQFNKNAAPSENVQREGTPTNDARRDAKYGTRSGARGNRSPMDTPTRSTSKGEVALQTKKVSKNQAQSRFEC